ncbi:TonB family protein [Martelella endophytica]|uniref:TonB C-terminal domain-containing protein n=1 Tax=Martelella endophytica TaxID=1486262 RepID=A0A0D5LKC9_MAREN|nr:TonB family protein [Martelella endophytica]AJY44606.1 hypothetical protein TM49_01185 [Martelella endophytica]
MLDSPAREEADGEPVVTPPEIEVDTAADNRFDAVVFELLSQANAKAVPLAPKTEAPPPVAAGPELSEADAEMIAPTLPRLVPLAAGRKRQVMSSAALGSVIFHALVFAMVMNVAKPVPEAPQEEGGVVVNVVSLGNGDADALAAGEDVIETPVEVEAQPVPVETARAVTAEPLEATRPVEQAQAPRPEVAETPAMEALPAAPAETPVSPALPRPEPEVLAVAPSEALSPDAVPPSAPPPAVVAETAEALPPEAASAVTPEAAEAPPPETAAALPSEPLEATPPAADTPLRATSAPSETVTATIDDPEFDIAPPVPQPSPWENEPLPEDQVAARKAAEPPPTPRRTVQRQTSGSGGQSSQNARRGAATATASSGATKAASARTGSTGDGAAAMANYAGKVGSRLRRAVAVERYYRGHGPLNATVVVRMTLNRGGGIASLSLARSSGNGAVDAIVLQRARSAGPFGSFPSSYSGNSHSFSLPINLKLER